MPNVSARALACCVVALATIAILSAETQRQDTAAVVAFQRSADSYTFLHRQVERTLGPGAADAQRPSKTPRGLQYRAVGKALVLIDAHVNLVIDVLPDAFPTTK